MRGLRRRRDAREAETERLREEVRQSVLQVMSGYDCQIQQGDDWIEVRGGPRACRFHLWMPADWVNLAVGDEGEYVLEWVLSIPGELAALVALLQRIVTGDLVDLPMGLNKTRLEGYSGYVPLAPPERSL